MDCNGTAELPPLTVTFLCPPKCGSILTLKICHPSCSKYFTIRAETNKKTEGDEYLDYLGKTFEQQQNFRAVSLDAFACINGWVSTVDKEFDSRQEQGGQVCSRSLWRYAKQYMHVQCLDAFLVNFARILHVHEARRYNYV